MNLSAAISAWALTLLVGCAHTVTTPATDALVPTLPLTMRVETLANGLKVVLQEDHRSPTVAVHLTYRVGASADPKGRSGFAHLFEHLMFEGSKHVPRGAFDTWMARVGGVHNASTDLDRTAYYEMLPSSQLDLALWLESDRMGYLLDSLDQGTLDNVRAVVKNEYRERRENMPYGALADEVFRAVFPAWHPYHRSVIGTPSELDAASLEEIRAFYLRWYGPNNATLVLVGDFDAAQALERVKRWFGPIPRSAPPPVLPKLPVYPLEADRTVLMDADVTLGRVTLAWPGPAYGDPGDVELTATANAVGWRVNGSLKEKKNLANAVGWEYWPGRFGGMFLLTILLDEKATPAQVIEATDGVLSDISRWAAYVLDDKTIHESLYSIYGDEVFELDGVMRRAATLGHFDLMAGNPGALPHRLRSYETLKPDPVIDVFRDRVMRTPRAVVIVRPKPGAPHAGVVVKS